MSQRVYCIEYHMTYHPQRRSNIECREDFERQDLDGEIREAERERTRRLQNWDWTRGLPWDVDGPA